MANNPCTICPGGATLAKSLYSENREEKETPKETAIYERKATRPKVASAKPDFTDKFSW